MSHSTIPEMVPEHKTAKLLKVPVVRLRNWRWQGRGLPYVRIGGKAFYRLIDIAEYLESRRVVPKQ